MMKKLRVVFMGTPEFAAHILEALLKSEHDVVGVVTVADKPAGRGQQIHECAVKKLARANQLPVLQPEKLKDETFLDNLKALEADLFVVVAFRMLPQVVWSMPEKGTINLHASLLPKYRGAAPINWAIINGEIETGVTTFFINERIDTGEILLQEKTAISPEMNAGMLHDKLMEIGGKLTVRTVNGIAKNELSAVPQDENLAKELPHAPKIFKEDCIIDWTKGPSEIVNHIRGLSPYPSAITFLNHNIKNQRIQFKIFSVRAVDSTEKLELHSSKEEVFIPCKGGMLAISEWQQEGKRRMTVKEWLVGNSLNEFSLTN